MAKVVVVKFRNSCKPYYFSAGDLVLEQGQGGSSSIRRTGPNMRWCSKASAKWKNFPRP